MINNIWIIMPVYNEEISLGHVVANWYPVLEKTCKSFTLCILNDGSKDNTLKIANELAAKYPSIKVVDKPNTGHGQTCAFGYQLALDNGADWVFQMDSDGQCDPQYFHKFVESSPNHKVLYGFRAKREDGFQRYIVSRIVSYFTLAATGVWVRDANVPYRLMHKSSLENIIKKIPTDFHLSNILVSVLQQKNNKIHWIDITFLDRFGGTPSVKPYSFAKHGFKLFKQLRKTSI
jgi:glycosyltransferase involved in cell wall biosynthesis